MHSAKGTISHRVRVGMSASTQVREQAQLGTAWAALAHVLFQPAQRLVARLP